MKKIEIAGYQKTFSFAMKVFIFNAAKSF